MPDPNAVAVAESIEEQKAGEAAAAEKDGSAAASAAAESEPQIEPSAEGGEPPRKGGVQRRIDELTRDRRLAEAEKEFWRTKALAGAQVPEKAPEPLKAKPNAADFETTEAYLDARDAWVRDETLGTMQEELKKRDQASEQRSEQEDLAADWGEKESAVVEKHPDYQAVTAEAMEALDRSKGPARNSIAYAIQYSEAGPQILYYLGQHPEEVERLASLHPTRAVIGLGRIEARLAEENPGGELPPQLRVPKPPTPIRKVGPKDDGELRDDLSPDEWRKRYLKKMETK